MTREIIYLAVFIIGALVFCKDLYVTYKERSEGKTARNYYFTLSMLMAFVYGIAKHAFALADKL